MRLCKISIAFVPAIFILSCLQPVRAQERTVTKVVAIAKPKMYDGPAPATLEFVGTIFVSRHPVTVEYQWERSDGAKGERRKITIRSEGQGVKDSWQLGAPGEHLRVWEKLHVLVPTGIASAAAVVTVNCRK